MIRISGKLKSKGLASKMILQVHDELVFEIPDNEIAVMKQLIKEKMESVVTLSVPILVELGVGKNWDEAH
jgi:DNA polymerase-1